MCRASTISPILNSAGAIGCCFALLILCLQPLSVGQASASLRGTVRDTQGNPVASAVVHLQSKDAAHAQTVSTDSQGNYIFLGLHAGVYALRATVDGYRAAEVPSLFLNTQERKTVDLAMLPVTVPASAGTKKPAFFDQPQFTVAGVTDTTSLGGHGSDTIVRTRETLAKETASLGTIPSSAAAGNYERERDELLAGLAREDRPALHHALGDVQEKLGNSLEAVREYQRAAEMHSSESYIFDWGSELLLHHAPEPAQEVFTRGNELFPHSVRMLVGVGASWFARGSYDQAVQKISAASDLNPNDPMPYLFLGMMQDAETTPSRQAVEKLHRFVTQQPENAEANYYYAVGLWKLGQAQQNAGSAAEIETLLRKAIHLDPKSGPAYLQLGILHAAHEDYQQAITDYLQAIRADPGMAEVHYRLAQVYRRTGDAAKAEAELRIYEQANNEAAQKIERERHQIRQFVYTLRDQTAPPAP